MLEAIGAGRDRILLTLATGTGNTFIAFQLAWKLFHSRWNLNDWRGGTEPSRRSRILFLADRNILADQAYNAFSAFADDALVRIDPADIRRKGRVPKNGSIFFTIFPMRKVFLGGFDRRFGERRGFGRSQDRATAPSRGFYCLPATASRWEEAVCHDRASVRVQQGVPKGPNLATRLGSTLGAQLACEVVMPCVGSARGRSGRLRL